MSDVPFLFAESQGPIADPLALRLTMNSAGGRRVGTRPLIVLSSSRPVTEFCVHGPPRQLERLPASVARHLSGRAVPGHVGDREDLVQPAQPEDRPPHQVHEGGRRHRRGGRQRGHRQGLRARQGHLHRGDEGGARGTSRWNRRAPSRSTSSSTAARSTRAT